MCIAHKFGLECDQLLYTWEFKVKTVVCHSSSCVWLLFRRSSAWTWSNLVPCMLQTMDWLIEDILQELYGICYIEDVSPELAIMVRGRLPVSSMRIPYLAPQKDEPRTDKHTNGCACSSLCLCVCVRVLRVGLSVGIMNSNHLSTSILELCNSPNYEKLSFLGETTSVCRAHCLRGKIFQIPKQMCILCVYYVSGGAHVHDTLAIVNMDHGGVLYPFPNKKHLSLKTDHLL